MTKLRRRIFARTLVALVGLGLWVAVAAGQTLSIIPLPVSLEQQDGSFLITSSTCVVAQGPAANEAAKLVEVLAPALGHRLRLVQNSPPAQDSIQLKIEPSLRDGLGEEGYELEATTTAVMIRAAAPAGLFYGIQTLRQLLPAAIFSKQKVEGVPGTVPCVRITDHPRFAWRGLLIDPARHFIPVADVEQYLDTMALHKFNHLQVHFTDDQGWRIEIKKYPQLTQTGAWMDFTTIVQGNKMENHRPGGFYTQEDIRHLVRYAAERYITIVPEIEMPAHTGAAIVSYPQIGLYPARLNALPTEKRWTAHEGVLAPRPQTVTFMQDVLTEVMDLFPSKYIHIGGDEANIEHWKKCEEMQRLIREMKLKDESELHSWFIRQMDTFLTAHGRRLIGWDEILQGGLAPGAAVMSWRGEAGGITAARAGHDVVMAPTSHTYFDYYQGPSTTEPKAIGGDLPLEKVYQYEPIPAALNADQARHVLGGQAQLWGEYISNQKHRFYMTYPRAAAMAEVVWSPRESRNWGQFLARLNSHLARLKALGVNYRPLDNGPASRSGRRDSNAPAAARALLQRLLPQQADRFTFETISPASGRDVFEIESPGDKVVLRGNTATSMAMGLNWYLKHYCRSDISLCGSQLNLPSPLPQVPSKVQQVCWAKDRYFLNYCCFGYSLPWWDWGQWERLIDWMALHGVNMPLAVTGQEAVWQAVCHRLGLTEEQIREFLAGPPYLPFQWMGCLDGWGGPLPQSWIDRHEELAKKILARERELGMTPVLQGFTGHVPAALSQKSPEAKVHHIRWIEWETTLLDPLDPLFAKVARIYLEEQAKRFGTDHLYAADTFIEMRPPSDDPKYLADLARAIYAGMTASDAEAIWVLQGWIFTNNPDFWKPPQGRALFGAVPDDRMLVLDLMCEENPGWIKTEAFYGKPWLWCNLQNFGNTVHLSGALNKIAQDLPALRRRPQSGKLVGLGFVNEGLGYNPVVYDLMFEMAWRDQPVEVAKWLDDYVLSRYGRANEDARRAWQILLGTVYDGAHYTRSVIDQVPHVQTAPQAPYDNTKLAGAWEALLAAAGALGEIDTFRFDLVNVARQVLSNRAAGLHSAIVQARQAKDASACRRASEQFVDLIRDMDRLLATRAEFLLGRWLEDAKRWGATDTERSRFEWNARRVLTMWGQTSSLDDYARKEWSGMVGGYYLQRWELFLHELSASLDSNRLFEEKEFQSKLRRWMADWSDQREAYPAQPQGDSIQVAKTLWAKYKEQLDRS
ncbi:MAG: family 20 glycosylhydrolase [Planctomycetes bacterium]|nr:family 20 glycosylhydrolase [Planctomycetota bacterium]